MKASVPYSDLAGTASASLDSPSDLNDFLVSRQVDTDRYSAIGASFYAHDIDVFSAAILCLDNEKSTEEKNHIVKFEFEAEFDKEEFFELFKGFEVVVTMKNKAFQNLEIDERITIDDRESDEEINKK